MNIQSIPLLDWRDLQLKIQELLGIAVVSEYWQVPDGVSFIVIDESEVCHSSGYFQGESKYILKYCLDIPSDDKWRDIVYPTDPQEFILQFAKSRMADKWSESNPRLLNGKSITLFDALEYLVVTGHLERGTDIMICHKW